MKQEEVFRKAKWLCAGDYTAGYNAVTTEGVINFPVLRGKFTIKRAENVEKAVLRVIGLGFFHCRINGKKISDDQFLPLCTNFEERKNYPLGETMSGKRIYVPEYDVSDFLVNGENVITIHFGGGWYTIDEVPGCGDTEVPYGIPKAIYLLTIQSKDGTEEIYSSTNDKIGDSFVTTYNFTTYENHDYTNSNESVFLKEYDDSKWKNALEATPVDTEYLFTDCPADRVRRELVATKIKEDEKGIHYDCHINMSGYPVLKIKAKKGEKITVTFSEELNQDGSPDMKYNFDQHYTVISDGVERIAEPQFTWFAFRYFTISGNAEVLCVKNIHTDVKVNSSFNSDNETLNWLYNVFLNTQLSNMHAGIPSDCPHIERRGYTGDGQLLCNSAMTVLSAEEFYRKWIDDIGDCQDIHTGHVQYTAPYHYAGGGPGGWGSAIVELPYRFYKHYGDIEPAKRLFPQMIKYFNYLECHSENHFITSDKDGCWCLGDWCAPDKVAIPAAFVNNYFYVKSMEKAIEIGRLIGQTEEINVLEKRIEERKNAIKAAYFNSWDGNYIGCIQGANAFAIDIGLGNENTYANLVKYYENLGRFDTGIFGTEIVTKVLFENGDGELAAKLLMSKEAVSYEGLRKLGATTLWEYWPNTSEDRSHNHPMFGAVTSYIFEYLVGIRQKKEKAGFKDIIIAPLLVNGINHLSATRTVKSGEISVSYARRRERIDFEVSIPEGINAVFQYNGNQFELNPGKNKYCF